MQDMLNQVKTQAAICHKKAKKEKKLQERAEQLSSEAHKALRIVRETLKTAEAAFEEEKVSLTKCAEEAKTKLDPVTQELATLKGHITGMCNAIFGKSGFTKLLK